MAFENIAMFTTLGTGSPVRCCIVAELELAQQNLTFGQIDDARMRPRHNDVMDCLVRLL
jgi:hypothetical protein